MAKNDGRSDDDFDGDGKGFPKYLAGVKVPKALRDQGKAAAELARSPLARELLTAGLAAAAAAVVANEKSRKRVKDAGQGAYDAAGEAVAGAGRIGSAILGAFTGLFSGGEDEEEAPRKRSTGGRKASGTSGRSGTTRRTAAKSSGTGARTARARKAENDDESGASAPKRRSATRGTSARGTGGRASASRGAGTRKASSRRGANENRDDTGGNGGQSGGEGGSNGNGGEGSGGGE